MRVAFTGDPSLCLPGITCGVSSFAGSVVHDAANAVIGVFTSALASAAAWLVGHVVGLVTGTANAATGPTHVDLLTEPWFLQRHGVMLQLLAFVLLPLLLAATIGPILRQDLRRLGRVWGVGLPVALLAGLLGTQFTQMAISATDALCRTMLDNLSLHLGGSLMALSTSMVIPGAPQLVAAVISLLLIAGAVLLWLELVVRAAAIYVAAFFMPLALACYVWPATATIAKRTIELLAALILSKFVIVATLSLGVQALGGRPSADNAVIGSAILLLAAFAPFSLLRLAPIVEVAAIAHLEGMSHRPLRTASSVATTAAGADTHPVLRHLVNSNASGGEGRPLASAAVVAQRIPERQADYPTDTGPHEAHGA